MHSLFQFIICCVVIVALTSVAIAQDKRESDVLGAPITAFASTERVRFTAPASVVQMHLEVYNEATIKLFDFELKGGNVLDWHLQNGQAERVGAGSYLCLVTVKHLSGKLAQKLGIVAISDQQVTVEPLRIAELKPQQAQAIGPLEADASLTVLKEGEAASGTVIAHNGEEGQLSRSQGALTFRLGDFYSGKDSEQMRLTAEGKLGIGVSDPQAKLDVSGPIRTSEGIVFPDGSIQTTAYVASGRSLSAQAGLQRDTPSRGLAEPGEKDKSEKGLRLAPNIGGTGTGGQLAKWAAANGTATDQLGNSVVTELNGNLGIGTTNPTAQIHASRGDGSYQYKMERTGSNARTYGFGADSNGNFFLDDVTGLARRLTLFTNGNIGIGTSTPANKLDVFGGIRAYFSSSTGMVAETLGGTNSWAQFHMVTPSQRWYIGTSNNFNGNQFYLVDGTTGQSRLTIQPAGGTISFPLGNVGIGAVDAFFGKLTVVADYDIGVYGKSNNSVGVYGRSDSNDGVVGGSANSHGVYGFSTNNAGVIGFSANDNGLEARSTNGFLVAGFPSVNSGVRTFHIELNGTYVAGSDFAESLPVRGNKASYEPGDVLVVTAQAPGGVEKSHQPYDVRVAGVYSTRPGMLGADKDGATRIDPGEVPVAIVGIVPTKASTENGPIRIGDLLTTARTPGYAMRCRNRQKCVRAGLGKALEPLAQGKGVIKVLVTVR